MHFKDVLGKVSTHENHGEYRVLEERRGDERPELVLDGVLGDVPPHGLGVQGELYAVALEKEKWRCFPRNKTTFKSFFCLIHLVLVKLAVLVRRLALVLEGDDDEADEDVDHEEGDDDDVDEVEDGHDGPVVVDGAHVLGVGVYGDVEDAGPALEGGDDEEGEHGLGHVVVVEVVPLPLALLHDRVVEVVVLVDHVVTWRKENI